MSTEQLTLRTNELAEQLNAQRQELIRRAQEHQEQHGQLEAANARISELEERLERTSRAGIRAGVGSPTSLSHEAAKRLDRWATSPGERQFAGDGSVGLREWIESMKESAGYCSDALQTAMEAAERSTD